MIVRRTAFLFFVPFLFICFAAEVQLDESGEQESPPQLEEAVVFKLIEQSGDGNSRIDIKTATGIAEIIQAAKLDPETHSMIRHMRKQDEYKAYAQSLTPDMIVSSLSKDLSEIKSTEILFQMRSPVEALEEMIRDNLVPEHRIAEYRSNTDLIADDTRKQLFFTFDSLAAAGGYL